MREEQELREHIEDTTKYGEFISTYFAWDSPMAQRKKVEKLENITKKKDENNKK